MNPCPALTERHGVARPIATGVDPAQVISDDTAATDRVEKLADYAELPSLRAYVLLEQTAITATLYQRQPGGAWSDSLRPGGDLTLPGLDIALPLAAAYQGLTFSA
jgi:Uma2 family endonuclease